MSDEERHHFGELTTEALHLSGIDKPFSLQFTLIEAASHMVIDLHLVETQ